MGDAPITETWSRFFRAAVGDHLTNQYVADKLGVSNTTISNWKHGKHFKKPAADLVVEFARAFYNGPLSDPLVAAGYGRPDEYSETVVKPDIGALSIDELLDEIRRRTGE
jgi:transcriptional regulator with XRE-family HTH domain